MMDIEELNARTNDGCPVVPYALMSPEPQLTEIIALLASRQRILELGAGAGRISDPLAEEGRDVVAVDSSKEMLARIKAARTVCSDIESLNLGSKFDAVLMVAHLVNVFDPRPLLAAASRHLSEGGLLIAERLSPRESWKPSVSRSGAVEIRLEDIVRRGPRVQAVTTYSVDGYSWRHWWRLWVHDDEALARIVNAAGLRVETLSDYWVTASLDARRRETP